MPDMAHPIEAIFFDVNGTLRSTTQSSESRKRQKIQQISELVGVQTSLDDFSGLLAARMAAYRSWTRENAAELSELDLWTRWMLPDYPAAHIRRVASQLHQLWREATGVRTMFSEVKEVLPELFRRGYRLGIVSNTLGVSELASGLRELGIGGLFETTVLSCQIGIRKPDPAILIEAASRLPVEPARCAYVGNRQDRDGAASKGAGFSKTVIIHNSLAQSEPDESIDMPGADHCIRNLRELLGIFPALANEPARPSYDASFSTLWARHNVPQLPDFFEVAGRLGFAGVELNHQINSAMLKDIDRSMQRVSSVHEPCPADVSTEELKERDWLISSTDEECRQHGVNAIKHSIDLAAGLRVPVIVVHAGVTSTDTTLELQLRRLVEAARSVSNEYHEIQSEMIEFRRSVAPFCMNAVKKSLDELLEYAGRFGVRLGLENRFHYYDIPSLDEMGELLALADSSRLGFVYDVGHAQHLDRLGFYAHEDWLRRYSHRIIEVHLHDVRGVNDHVAPGLGDIDFDMVTRYLPEGAIRTLELQPSNTPEQVKACLRYLAGQGCIKTI
jgi:sugar phosphate isomerase/epimerase/FMN phosphatase YigB (HAD superfamily)